MIAVFLISKDFWSDGVPLELSFLESSLSDVGALEVYPGNFDSSQDCQITFGGVERMAKSTKCVKSVVFNINGF